MFLSPSFSLSPTHWPYRRSLGSRSCWLVAAGSMQLYIYLYTLKKHTQKYGPFQRSGGGCRGEESRGERERERDDIGRRWGGDGLSPQHTADVSQKHLIRMEVKEKVAWLYSWTIPYVTCYCTAKEQDIDTYFIGKDASVPYSDSTGLAPPRFPSLQNIRYCARHPNLGVEQCSINWPKSHLFTASC